MLILIQYDNFLDEGEKTFQTYLTKIEVRKDFSVGYKSGLEWNPMDTFHHFKEFPEYYNCCDYYCCVFCNFVLQIPGLHPGIWATASCVSTVPGAHN